jgi:hypothetical protein
VPNSLRLRRVNLADKTLYRLIGIAEVVLLDQILVDTLGTQANLELSANYLSQTFAPSPVSSPNAGNRNGCFDCVSLARFPVIEIAGFQSAPSSEPVIEMVGFAKRRYRRTVSRLIPNSLAIVAATINVRPGCKSLFAGSL